MPIRFSKDHIPPPDPHALEELEIHAEFLAALPGLLAGDTLSEVLVRNGTSTRDDLVEFFECHAEAERERLNQAVSCGDEDIAAEARGRLSVAGTELRWLRPTDDDSDERYGGSPTDT